MASARCGLCGGTTQRMDDMNRAERRRTHQRNPAGIRPVSIDHDRTCPEHPTNRRKAHPHGEYRLELRDNASTQVWRPSVDSDPVPDHNDMATETAAQKQRELVTRWNREIGWYKYRTIYVPADQGPDPMTERLSRKD